MTPAGGEAVRSVAGEEIAIIGMACLFPAAPDVQTYWRNIGCGVDAVTEVTPDRWDPEVFFDPNSTAPERLYCKRGGYLGDLARCNPLEYGMMPVVMNAGEPDQVLTLRVAHEALADAGYAARPFNRERTEVILGRGNYPSPGHVNLALHTLGIEQTLQIVKNLHPEHTSEELEEIRRELKASLPHLGPDTAGALIPNLTTGRVVNRLDLMGVNFTIDAACASALIALDLAIRDLRTERCDLALVGGTHMANHVPFLAVFSQLGALSRQSEIRPFDKDADGLVAGEGVGVVVLKRREEAERDGDRIYAIIKGVGTASDGRGQGLLAPRVEGEELAMRRAYESAGIAPESVELIEAHGTGTPVGDLAEIQALTRVFGRRLGPLPTCAVGSVKSMIGHLMPAAGIAGLIKAALALYHRVLPPTLHFEAPNPKFELEKTPFYINTESRPWVHGGETPRRAGVSAFGFGGINAHVILEEHAVSPSAEPGGALPWDSEVCILQADSRRDVVGQGHQLERYLATGRELLKDLASTLNRDLRQGAVRLAVVAASIEDLRAKLGRALARLEDPACRQIKDASGIYFFEDPLLARGKLAFLFPGEASQYPNMLRDLCLHFPEIRAEFDRADRVYHREGRPLRPSQAVFPPPGASEEERANVERRLWEMGGALDAILTANWALHNLLRSLEIQPDVLLGHSSGEYSALTAAGVVTPDAAFLERLVALSATSERLTAEGSLPEAVLVAAGADRAAVAPLIERFSGEVFLAMDNCPHQVVLVGREAAMESVVKELGARGVICQKLPFTRAYHTPLFRPATRPLDEALRDIAIAPPTTEIYCGATVAPYPRTPLEIRELVVELWSRPVEFTRTVEALYEAGVKVFVEVGPRGNLTAFVDDILRGRPHLAVPCDAPRRSGTAQLNHLVGLLAAHGARMRLDILYERRSPQRLAFEDTRAPESGKPQGPLGLPVPMAVPMVRVLPRPVGASPSRARPRVEPTPSGPVAHPVVAGLAHGSASARGTPVASVPALAPGPELIPGRVPGPASTVVTEHFRIMERFLAVEEEVMEAFLGGTVAAPPSEAPPFALVGTVVSLTPGQEVVVRRRLDLEEDLLLRDHTLGRRISDADPTLRPLPVVPFTGCVEMMAEVASLLSPGEVMVRMRQLQIKQWIEVDRPTTLEITARRSVPGEEVAVEVRNLGADDAGSAVQATVVAEGRAVFAPAYPEPPSVAPLSLRSPRPCPHTAEQMYEDGLMFHGARFQSVVSLDRSGENGLIGHLEVLPRTDLFASTTTPRFASDPVLLDAAGQLLGYWASQHLSTGYTVFPFRVATLEIYGESPAVFERVRCEVEIHQVTARQVRCTLSLIGSDGRLRLRLSDWEDWRFYWPREFYDCFRMPRRNLGSRPWALPVAALPQRGTFACQRVEITAEAAASIAAKIMPHLILSRNERRQWEALTGPEKRRLQWVLGRGTAKDAIRTLVKARYGVELYPPDVEIDTDPDGRPFARLLALGDSVTVPSVSIAHSEGLAVALAAYDFKGPGPGIDIERIRSRDDAFLRIAFDDRERELLASLGEVGREEWVARLWCAKEAVAKTLGKGLMEGPRSLTVEAIEPPTGRVTVVLRDGLGRRFPDLVGVALVAHTAREGEWVVASSVGERG